MSTPYVTLPGTSGRYVSSSDVNLLDADSAHLAQTKGLWTVGALSADYPLFGATSLKVTGGVDTAITPTTDAAMFSCYVYSVAGADFDINGSAAVTVPAATWTQLSETGPDGTYTIGCSTAADYYVGKACVRSGTDPTFVPSLRIVGDLDMRANLSPDSVTTYQRILNTEDGSDGYSLLLASTSGEVYVANGDGSTNRSGTSSGMGLAVGQASEVRVTYDISAGTITYYKDDVSVDTDSCTVAASSPSGEPLNVGTSNGTAQMLDADLYWVEVRDGIDGPVVARFDAADTAKATL